MVQDYLLNEIIRQQLPHDFAQTLSKWYLPLAEIISKKLTTNAVPLVLGVQGCQGSGKSTLAEFLRLIFKYEYSANCAVLSLDDFYRTRAERTALSQRVHPLLKTRGVPGTHDIFLALKIIQQLKTATLGEQVHLPRFNKAIDDRAPENEWALIEGPVDIIIFEGWCTGLAPEPAEQLIAPVNSLEAEEDEQAIWRNYVNQQLAGDYQLLFKQIDFLTILTAPSFDSVYAWRLLQEQKLAQHWASQQTAQESAVPAHIQSPEQLQRFIAHYQRLTQWALTSLPARAQVQLQLNDDHQITRMNLLPNEFVQRSGS